MRAKGQAQLQDGRRRVTLTPRLAGAQRPETPSNDGVYWQHVGNPTRVPPEESYRSFFRKYAAESSYPSDR